MARRLRYSERKALAETGNLGPLQDDPSEALRNALKYLVAEGENASCGQDFQASLYGTCVKHFGWPAGQVSVKGRLGNEADLGRFLDLVEIICEEGGAVQHTVYLAMSEYNTVAIPDAEGTINDLFERHRFGYRLEDGEIRKIGSPVLDEIVVGPALLASQKPGWDEVERSFKEAIRHQRGGADENDDALTAANAAVEAALQAAGFDGTHLGPLAKDFKKSTVVPSELKGVPEALDILLQRIGAVRNSHSDSHGKKVGADAVPQELVDLAIHWAGSFILYISQAAKN